VHREDGSDERRLHGKVGSRLIVEAFADLRRLANGARE
jgi:hypothetical protein